MDETQALQVINDALPASGDVPYDQLYEQIRVAGNVEAMRQFHRLRRAGKLAIRTERTSEGLKMYVGRQSA